MSVMTTYSSTDPTVAAVIEPSCAYGRHAPFHPAQTFPEYPFEAGHTDPSNGAYGAVRTALVQLGLDRDRAGTSAWNPFGELMRARDRVVIKPNAVLDHNQDASQDVFASITHPSVLRAVIDFCVVALGPRAEIVIADAPLMSADFAAWRRVMQLDQLQAFYRERGITIRVLDLRETVVRWTMGFTPSMFRRTEQRDPAGYTDVDLGDRSLLAELSDADIRRAYGADYRVDETINFHSGGRHVYRVSNTVLSSDVLISVPKLKVHSKVGVTMAIKGMVGIIGDKNSIIHHRRGPRRSGGDEYPGELGRAQALFHDWRTKLITRIAAKQTNLWDAVYLANEVARRALETFFLSKEDRMVRGGGWSGNDTAWRMGSDLLRIALYARPGQQQLGRIRRRTFVIVDGIIGGDLHGPLAPRARSACTIVAGANPVAVDWVGARLMNIDPSKLKLLTSCRDADDLGWVGSDRPVVKSDDPRISKLWQNDFHLGFEVAPSWRGAVEMFAKAS
jgi:uncharacterized protein (DUF362 family)